MKFLVIAVQLFLILCKTLSRSGVRSLVAENLALKMQLKALTRSQARAKPFKPTERIPLGFLAGLSKPKRIKRIVHALKPQTLLSFHRTLVKRKYSVLFGRKVRSKPGPRGPSKEIIEAIVAMKKMNPQFDCPRIAMQINSVFGLKIDTDFVRRVLNRHFRRGAPDPGPSWLSFFGQMKDSL